MALDDLYKMANNYKEHLKFLKEVGMCNKEETNEIIANIKTIYAVIGKCVSSSSLNKKVVSS